MEKGCDGLDLEVTGRIRIALKKKKNGVHFDLRWDLTSSKLGPLSPNPASAMTSEVTDQ